MTLQTPRVVFDLRDHISFLQTVVQNLCLIVPITAKDQKLKGFTKYYHYVHVSVPTIELYDKDVHVAVQKSGVCKMLYCLKKKITKAASI